MVEAVGCELLSDAAHAPRAIMMIKLSQGPKLGVPLANYGGGTVTIFLLWPLAVNCFAACSI